MAEYARLSDSAYGVGIPGAASDRCVGLRFAASPRDQSKPVIVVGFEAIARQVRITHRADRIDLYAARGLYRLAPIHEANVHLSSLARVCGASIPVLRIALRPLLLIVHADRALPEDATLTLVRLDLVAVQ